MIFIFHFFLWQNYYFFIKSISIFNEMDYNLKCSAPDREFDFKGAFLTKNSRKIQHLFEVKTHG